MGGAVMTHPTDDELEAMAVRLEDGRVCSPAQNSCRNGYLLLEAAAMLRACKGRDDRSICDYCDETDPEIQAACFAKQCGIALEPAPDHSEWNAAIEAAARTLEERGSDGWAEKVMAEYAAVCAAEIRAITPPERPKP